MSRLTFLKEYRLYLSRKLIELLQRLLAAAQPRLERLAQQINVEQPYRVEIGHPDRIAILLVGAGGTGSFVAHILAQLACWAKTANIDMRLYFIDPDFVEVRRTAA